MNELREIKDVLDENCQPALRQPLPDKQLTLMTDASFQAVGYEVSTEDDANEQFTSCAKAMPQ